MFQTLFCGCWIENCKLLLFNRIYQEELQHNLELIRNLIELICNKYRACINAEIKSMDDY